MLQGPAKDDAFYIVLTSGQSRDVPESSLAEAARLLRLSIADLNRLAAVGQPMPLARAGTVEAANLVRENLRALGIQSISVPKKDLKLDEAAKRVCACDFTEDSLTAIPARSGGRISVRWEELTLIVAGLLLSSRVEVEENKSRRRKQLVDKRELSADESVVDIYTAIDEVNWRITASAFDFSCLGAAKKATAFENFSVLLSLFLERATNAQYDDSYKQGRQVLAAVWPLEQRSQTNEGRRSGARKFNLATITTTDNESQFTRYSRLRHYLQGCEQFDTK